MKRRSFLGAVGALGAGAAVGGDVFLSSEQLFSAGLVLGPGPAGRADDSRLGGPIVRWDASAGEWRMWYYGRNAGFPQDMAPNFGTGSILTALSRDGFQWRRISGPLRGGAVLTAAPDPAAFDSGHVATGDVVRDGDAWLMVYFGGGQELTTDTAPLFRGKGYVLRPGIARSSDGVNWRRVPGTASGGAAVDVVEGDVYSGFPNMIHDGERFLMYFTTVDKHGRYWRTRMATSTDANEWTSLGDLVWDEDPALFEAGGVITRHVMRNPFADDPPWLMVYTAKDGRSEAGARRSVGVAVSDDALTWRKLFRYPVLTVGREGAWDHGGVAVPRLVVTDTDVRLYYYGWSDGTFAGPPQRGIGVAVAGREDPWRFRRYVG